MSWNFIPTLLVHCTGLFSLAAHAAWVAFACSGELIGRMSALWAEFERPKRTRTQMAKVVDVVFMKWFRVCEAEERESLPVLDFSRDGRVGVLPSRRRFRPERSRR